ncbi:MAG: DUF3365 domain-containing protein, partial [Candidatus Bathyarchaeia archaeon]
MRGSKKAKTLQLPLERYIGALAVAWTVIIAVSLAWNVAREKQDTLEMAHIQAQEVYDKDIIYRRWNTEHGGVYVPLSENTQPNPYLSHMPERDITTPSGRQLTVMNPAYMTRQVHELAEEEYGVRGHITSLNPIRPENVPDPWETKALQAFEEGEAEVASVEMIEGKEYLRLMRPLITEKGCLKCHALQGYQEGNIRGGISVAIPMKSLWTITRSRVLALAGGHVLLWLVGLGGIVLGRHNLIRSEQERRRANEAIQEAKDVLEIRVEERTSELSDANKHLRREITERKRADEELTKLATAINQANETVMILDTDGIITYVNPALEEQMGYSSGGLIGTNLIPRDRRPDQKNLFQKAWKTINEGNIWTGHMSPNSKDGSILEFDVTISPIRDSSGKITSFV